MDRSPHLSRGVMTSILLALAACYNPTITTGVPCNELSACPVGQACVAGVCGGLAVGVDAAVEVDAAPASDGPSGSIVDRDGDGVADAVDNCPDVANPDQGNEDGDKFGDACDPCPIEASDTPSDPDGDGVAGICDPHPTTPGDHLMLFEGFHRGIPSSWQVVGTASPSGDDAVVTTVAGNHTALIAPITAIANGTITAAVTIDATLGNADAAMTVVMPYDPTSDQGIFCELYAPNAGSASGHYVSLWDSPAQSERDRRNFAWTAATPYRVALTRKGTGYTCSVTPNGGTAQTTSATTSSNPAQARASVASYGANAHVAWVLVVSSP